MREPRPLPTVHAYLLWLVLACLLPGVLGASMLLISQYRQTRNQLENATVLTARAMSQVVDNYLLRVQAVAQGLAASTSLQRGDLGQFHVEATEALSRLGMGANIVLRDARGQQLLNTAVPWGQPLTPPAAPEQVQAVFATSMPTISDLFLGPVMAKRLVAVDVPVIRNGEVRYALGVGVLASQLSELLQQQKLPQGWTALIVDRQDMLLARSREPERYVGQKAPPGFREQTLGRQESIGESVIADGTRVFLIHTTSPLTKWRTGIGIPRDAVEEALRWTAAQIAASIALLFGLGTFLAWRLGGRISCAFDDLGHAAQDLGAGRPVKASHQQLQEAQVVVDGMREAAQQLEMRSARLRSIDRRKDEFIALMAHELRNPLAPVRTAVEILRRAKPGDASDQRARQVIERQVAHMSRMIEDLLDVARIARGTLSLARECCDLGLIARQVAHDWQILVESTGLTLRIQVPDTPVWIDADPVRVAQMMSNLLTNAMRFTPRGGWLEVAVGLAEGGTMAWMHVKDNGVGIDPALLERLFDPFSQADQDLARTKGGLGLGLALTRSLAQLHGGRATAHSEGLGQGATFTVWLPRASSPATAPVTATRPSRSPPP